METFSALLALCNSLHKCQWRGVWCFRLSKQSWGWWFKTPSRPLWRHCNVEPLPLGRQRPVYRHRQTPWSIMAWRRDDPGQHWRWYWNSSGFCTRQVKRQKNTSRDLIFNQFYICVVTPVLFWLLIPRRTFPLSIEVSVDAWCSINIVPCRVCIIGFGNETKLSSALSTKLIDDMSSLVQVMAWYLRQQVITRASVDSNLFRHKTSPCQNVFPCTLLLVFVSTAIWHYHNVRWAFV